ncbi:M23 family metallopeptidase [Nannocystis bainbridge]|uniref:M23 family metallopeptidase n=1 Tax=Nannocystis bainbridge TaxID=2995303 RepID=A0ABT5DQV3_9BACT|nr:M23 family metallopeptidase [Nannocystis bainbridge]MDC0715513.1 M23 family metallopeptidase [Nannocystis bainbridge]
MALSLRTSSPVLLAGLLACGDAGEPATPVVASTGDVPADPVAPADPPPAPDPFAAEGIEAARPGLRFGWPVESPHITSYFGWRTNPMTGVGTKLHRGLDLRGGIGDLILSIGPGVVQFAGQDLLLGNLVIIDHGLGVTSYYGHMHDILVHVGLPVDRGTALGLVGNTGRSEAPHLHLTVKIGALAVDPLWLIGAPLHGYPGLPALAEADTDAEY